MKADLAQVRRHDHGFRCELRRCESSFSVRLRTTTFFGCPHWITFCVRHEPLVGSGDTYPFTKSIMKLTTTIVP